MENRKTTTFKLSDAAVRNYINGLSVDLDELRHAMERSDLARVREICHRLRGSSAMYGFSDLGVACGEVEEFCLNGSGIDAVVSGLQVIEVIFNRSLPPIAESEVLTG